MRLCVFCGSSNGRARYVEVARQVGETLAGRGIGIVFGGARVGTMGALADSALAAGGEVIGVIPQSLVDWEIAHTGVSELHVVDSLHARKAMMAELSDGFIALPGGTGTLEEFFEVWTWAQLGLHAKPVGLLDVDGFFTHLRRFVDHLVAEGFTRPPYRDMLQVAPDLDTLLAAFATYQPPVYKWSEDELTDEVR